MDMHVMYLVEGPFLTHKERRLTRVIDIVGGAIGLFGHGPFRIATERTIFAMPETSLGLFPSSGATFFLPKLDGQIGTYLALTGSRIEGAHTL